MAKQKKQRKGFEGMPALTVDGKRQILQMAIHSAGEAAVIRFLSTHDIPSIQYAYEQVRKYKARFFRELYQLGKQNLV